MVRLGLASPRLADAVGVARVTPGHVVRVGEIAGRTVHLVGLPYHWGSRGLVTGGSANDLTGIEMDPNVHIQESKALTCAIRPGRLAGGDGKGTA